MQDYKKEEVDQDKIEHEMRMQAEGGAANPKAAQRIVRWYLYINYNNL